MKKLRIKTSIVCLRIASVIYFIIAAFSLISLGLISEISDVAIITASAIFTFGFGIGLFLEIIIRDLKHQRYWAWVAGIIVFGMFIPSLFFILGILGLINLLKPEVSKAFKE